MVQIDRRALSNYFKMIIRNRVYANNTCFLKNEVSRTPMWTRDFLAPYHNIQIINRRLQLVRLRQCLLNYHNIQIINRRLQQTRTAIPVRVIITYKSLTGDYSQFVCVTSASDIITYKSLTGDYSSYVHRLYASGIITYKSLTGDYSYRR